MRPGCIALLALAGCVSEVPRTEFTCRSGGPCDAGAPITAGDVGAASRDAFDPPDAQRAADPPDALSLPDAAADAAASTDGGQPADAEPFDAPANAAKDAASDDASTPPDAAQDAGNVADTGASLLGVRCANVSNAAFCDDFDSTDLANAWGNSPYTTLGSLARDSSAFTSSGMSLRGEARPTSSSNAAAGIVHDVTAISDPMLGTLDFDMRVDHYGSNEALVAYITLNSPQGGSHPAYTLQLGITGTAVHIIEDLQNVGAEMNQGTVCSNSALPAGEWHHLSFRFDLTTAAAIAELSIDGGPPCSRVLQYVGLRASPWIGGIILGFPWVDPQPAGEWTIHQDSVVFRLP